MDTPYEVDDNVVISTASEEDFSSWEPFVTHCSTNLYVTNCTNQITQNTSAYRRLVHPVQTPHQQSHDADIVTVRSNILWTTMLQSKVSLSL